MSVIIYEKSNHIGRIIFNRPKARNAFNRELVQKLNEVLEEVSKDDDVHVDALRLSWRSGDSIVPAASGDGTSELVCASVWRGVSPPTPTTRETK